MTNPLLLTLAEIGEKPNATPRTKLIVARRTLRNIRSVCETIHEERRALRRQARKLRQRGPLTARHADALEQQAAAHREIELEAGELALLGYGAALLHDRDGWRDALGFDDLCDLLSVSPGARERARRKGMGSLAKLILVHRLEDSAGRRGEDTAEGPLFTAFGMAAAALIGVNLGDGLADPFALGGPLYGVPVCLVKPDGSEIIKRPDLTVHDASGSRVVKR